MPAQADRWLLLGDKRNEVLALWEVQQYGCDSFGDPDHMSIYGRKPHQWYARGARILGRTAVEYTPDRLADLIGRDVAAVARASPAGFAPVSQAQDTRFLRTLNKPKAGGWSSPNPRHGLTYTTAPALPDVIRAWPLAHHLYTVRLSAGSLRGSAFRVGAGGTPDGSPLPWFGPPRNPPACRLPPSISLPNSPPVGAAEERSRTIPAWP